MSAPRSRVCSEPRPRAARKPAPPAARLPAAFVQQADAGLQAPAAALHEAAVIEAALAILGARLRKDSAVLTTPADVKRFMVLQLAALDTEHFAVLFLDAKHRAIAFEKMFRGTLTFTSVHPREIARRALAHNAAAVVLAHNHPSGCNEPSKADEILTATAKAALELVDVRVLDHIVVGGVQAMSFAERGLI